MVKEQDGEKERSPGEGGRGSHRRGRSNRQPWELAPLSSRGARATVAQGARPWTIEGCNVNLTSPPSPPAHAVSIGAGAGDAVALFETPLPLSGAWLWHSVSSPPS
nr:unnamed protein product [Digitaria exilis]